MSVALAWCALIVQLRADARPRPRILWVLLISLALITILFNPVVEQALDSTLPGVGAVAGNIAAILIIWCASEVLRDTDSASSSSITRRKTRLIVLGAVTALQIVFYALGIPTGTGTWPLWERPFPPTLWAYWVLVLGYAFYLGTYVFVVAIRRSAEAGPSPARVSLRLMAATGACTWLVCFTNVSVIAGARYVDAPAFQAAWYLGLFLYLALLSLALMWQWLARKRVFRLRRQRRYLSQLEPLWERLREADPAIILQAASADPPVQLTRKLVEIHDGLMTLSRELPPDSLKRAREIVGVQPGVAATWQQQVTAASVWIYAGLMRHEQSPRPGRATATPGMEGDLETEACFFAGISQTFASESVRRLAEELVAPTPHS